MSLVVVMYYLKRNHDNQLSRNDVENEAKYAETIAADIQQKPYISKLPIKTDYYTVIYSSVNKRIVVIFKNSGDSATVLKSRYQEDIFNRLRSFSVDEGELVKVSWEKEI